MTSLAKRSIRTFILSEVVSVGSKHPKRKHSLSKYIVEHPVSEIVERLFEMRLECEPDKISKKPESVAGKGGLLHHKTTASVLCQMRNSR